MNTGYLGTTATEACDRHLRMIADLLETVQMEEDMLADGFEFVRDFIAGTNDDIKDFANEYLTEAKKVEGHSEKHEDEDTLLLRVFYS